MLVLIGQGLSSEYDLSLNSIKVLKESERVFLESYTSLSNLNISNLESLIGKKVEIADREFTESNETIIELSKNMVVCLIIIGTPMFATTHTDILLRAKMCGVKTKVIHNSSIMNVMGCFGLYSYSFGRTISIPFYEENWKPTSFFDYFLTNYKNKMHTLCLLDIKVKEVNRLTLFSEKKEYEKPRFMTPNQALNQLLHCDEKISSNIFVNSYKIFAISRFGTETEKVYYDNLENLIKIDFGEPLHSIILPCDLDAVEKENVAEYFKDN